ncbi:MAG: TadE/TadG family type IV pilus assembly protein, partial [Rhabdaerophilum sp.]
MRTVSFGLPAFRKLVERFAKAREGVMPVVFAITLVPMLALIGMSIDYAGARSSKAQLQSAADAAALEALTASERLESEAGNEANFIKNDASYKPIARGQELFKALAETAAGFQNAKATIEVERKGQKFTVRLKYSAEYINRMPHITAAAVLPIEGLAGSTLSVSGAGYLDIYTLLDTSSSMGIGASAADIAALEAWKEGPNYSHEKQKGCAFSCHGEKPAGVQLRVDVMRDAVQEMIKSAEAEYKKQEKDEPARIRIALNKFDHQAFSIEPLSSNYTKLSSVASEIKLHPTDHRGTNAKRAINWLTPKVPHSGNGLSQATPRRFVFIVTDGLQDRHPAWQGINFPGPYGADDRTGPIDPNACNALKSKGVTVAILYTTHIGIKDYEWYWEKPQPLVRPNLKACASDQYF